MDGWMWPQWGMAAFTAVAVVFGPFTHGKPKTGSHNYWESMFWVGLQVWLLHMGGFW